MISLGNILLSSPSSLVEIVYKFIYMLTKPDHTKSLHSHIQAYYVPQFSDRVCVLLNWKVTIWAHHIPALIINFIDSIVLWNIPLFMEQPRSPLHGNILLLVY